jgi:hypothetical protein
MRETHNNEEEFDDNCPCAFQIYEYVQNITDTDVRWFFDISYSHYPEDRHTAIYKSYASEEYKDYILSVEGKKNNMGGYDLRIIKKVDNLVK